MIFPLELWLTCLALGDRPTLFLGGSLALGLSEGGRPTELEVQLTARGPLCVRAESFDCDLRIELRDENDGLVAADDDSGVACNPEIFVSELGPGVYRLRVEFEKGETGSFTVSAHSTRAEPPAQRLRADLDYRAAAVRRALAHGATVRANAELEEIVALARHAWERGLADDAMLAIGLAESLADELDRGDVVSGAWLLSEAVRLASLPSAEERLGLEALLDTEGVLPDVLLALLQRTADLRALAGDGEGEAELVRKLLESSSTGSPEPLWEIVARVRCAGIAAREGRPADRQLLLKELPQHSSNADLREADLPRASLLFVDAGMELTLRADYVAALDCFDWVLAREVPLELRLRALGEKGNALMALDRYAEARALFEIVAQRAKESSEPGFELHALANLADVMFRFADLVRAREIVEEVARRSAVPSPIRVDLAMLVGAIEEVTGDLLGARSRYEAAGATARESGDETKDAWAHVNLARLALAFGDLSGASELSHAALAIALTSGDATARASALEGLGRVALEEGDLVAARELSGASHREFVAAGRIAYALYPLFTLALVDQAAGQGDSAWERVGEADATLTELGSRGLTSMEVAGTRSLYADWAELAQDLAASRVAAADASERRALVREGFDVVSRWKAQGLLAGIRAGMPTEDRGATERFLERFARDGRLVVEFAEGRTHLYAYAIGAEGHALVDLGPRAVIADQVAAFRKGTEEESLLSTAELIVLGRELRARLLDPVLVDAGATDTLLIVPSACLSVLAFDALAEESLVGDFPSYVGDRFAITYVPSIAVAAELARRERRSIAERALVLGDPVYADESGSQSTRGSLHASELALLHRLEDTHKEALVLGRILLREAQLTGEQSRLLRNAEFERSGAVSTPTFDLLLGDRATIDALRASTSGRTLIHLAAHGLAADDPRRSGIVLSAAHGSPPLLSLEDVLGLELDAELVVLSACSTGSGRVLRGEGVQSLAYGFLSSGARSIVATLWKVPDRTTFELMENFYRLVLLDDLPPGKALRRARHELRNAMDRGFGVSVAVPAQGSAHPSVWAPYVFIGVDPFE